MNYRIKETLDRLILDGIIPKTGFFDITESKLRTYVDMYGLLFSKDNKKYDYVYARKLAGLNLLKLKFNRGGTPSSCHEGLVYLIGNRAWPTHTKVGMTIDLDKRLDSYQTSDPYRSYYVKHYEFVLERRNAERQILNDYGVNIENGEWLNNVNANEVIKSLANTWKLMGCKH